MEPLNFRGVSPRVPVNGFLDGATNFTNRFSLKFSGALHGLHAWRTSRAPSLAHFKGAPCTGGTFYDGATNCDGATNFTEPLILVEPLFLRGPLILVEPLILQNLLNSSLGTITIYFPTSFIFETYEP